MRTAVLSLCLLLLGASGASGKKYALLIGISEYSYRSIQQGVRALKFADDDARALEKVLESEYDVLPLVDDDARHEDIIEALVRLRTRTTPEDTLVVFFAGHGVFDPSNGQTYWLTYDTQLELLDDRGLELGRLLKLVGQIKAKQKILLLDHCFSGEISYADLSAAYTRGDKTPRGVRIVRNLGRVGELRPQLAPPEAEGLVVLAAANAEAFESPNLGHGYFTEALLRAMRSRKADEDENGELSITELVSFVKTEVSALAAAEGRSQNLVDVIHAENLPQWTFVKLPPDLKDAEEKRIAWMKKLQAWRATGLLDLPAWLHCRKALNAWIESLENSVEPDPATQDVVREIGDHMALLGSWEEQELARSLNDLVGRPRE